MRIFFDGSHCNCKAGDTVIQHRPGREDRKMRVVNTHGKPQNGKAPLWWIRHCESYGDVFTKIDGDSKEKGSVCSCKNCGCEIKNDVGDGLCAECWSKN